MTHDVGRWWIKTAGPDILEGDVELDLFCLAAIDRGSAEDVPFLSIYAPQAVAVGDDGSGSECSVVRHNGLPHAVRTEMSHGLKPWRAPATSLSRHGAMILRHPSTVLPLKANAASGLPRKRR